MQRVRGALTPHGFTIFCPEGNLFVLFFSILSLLIFIHRSKAVSDGAVSFHLDHFVSTRVARFGYGTSCRISYNPGNPEHLKRSSLVRTRLNDGKMYIADLFKVILPKVFICCVEVSQFNLFLSIRQHTAISEEKEFRARFQVEFDTLLQFKKTTCKIECYKGLRKEELLWKDAEPGKLFPKSTSDLKWRVSRDVYSTLPR